MATHSHATTPSTAGIRLEGTTDDAALFMGQLTALGLADKVVFTGHVSEEEKRRLMASCKVFAFPSMFESFGLAAAEAMAYGKPVVASNVGGLPEVVGDGGILVPPASPQELAAALDRLLKDDGLRHELGRRARDHIRPFSWDNIAAKIERIYLEEAKR